MNFDTAYLTLQNLVCVTFWVFKTKTLLSMSSHFNIRHYWKSLITSTDISEFNSMVCQTFMEKNWSKYLNLMRAKLTHIPNSLTENVLASCSSTKTDKSKFAQSVVLFLFKLWSEHC